MPAITPIQSAPHCITPQEHSDLVSKTPENFDDIPPVLRCKRENVRVESDPPIPGLGSPITGTLYVIESVLAFTTAEGSGFQISYPNITLHAISSAGTQPYIYLQLDDSDGAEVPDEEDAPMSELKLWPGNMASVEAVFEALSHCSTLHPDPNIDEDGLGEDNDGAFMNAEEFEVFTGCPDEELSEVGRAMLAHLESVIEPRHPAVQEADAESDSDPESSPAGPPDHKPHFNGA